MAVQARQDEKAAADEAEGDFGEGEVDGLHSQVGQVLGVQEKNVEDEAEGAGDDRTR